MSFATTTPKAKACAHCGETFTPARPMQSVCSALCAVRKGRADQKAARADVKRRKEAIKTIPELIKEAQVAFNAYIRARDEKEPCICCGQPLGAGSVGGGYDAGHWRSTGSASHLRFNEDNCHAQRKYCNRHGAGRAVDYRIGLIQRIGLERVAALETNNAPHKWQRDELIAIRATYKAKLKTLKDNHA